MSAVDIYAWGVKPGDIIVAHNGSPVYNANGYPLGAVVTDAYYPCPYDTFGAAKHLTIVLDGGGRIPAIITDTVTVKRADG